MSQYGYFSIENSSVRIRYEYNPQADSSWVEQTHLLL